MDTNKPRATKRTDPHRAGAIIPAHYECVLQYSLASMDSGHPVPACGINCELDYAHEGSDPATGKTVRVLGAHDASGQCCVLGLRMVAKAKFAEHGATGKCTACGACFKHGDVWRHIATDEHIHLGYDCVAKYEMLVDRSAHELQLGRLREAAAVQCEKARRLEARTFFLTANPGLEQALKCEHRIVRDIAARFEDVRKLSEKQVALVLKLAHEAANPRAAELHVAAPIGRVSFRGEVVSTKMHDSDYGSTMKMVIKVRTDAGVWLAWMTAPSNVLGNEVLRGCTWTSRRR